MYVISKVGLEHIGFDKYNLNNTSRLNAFIVRLIEQGCDDETNQIHHETTELQSTC